MHSEASGRKLLSSSGAPRRASVRRWRPSSRTKHACCTTSPPTLRRSTSQGTGAAGTTTSARSQVRPCMHVRLCAPALRSPAAGTTPSARSHVRSCTHAHACPPKRPPTPSLLLTWPAVLLGRLARACAICSSVMSHQIARHACTSNARPSVRGRAPQASVRIGCLVSCARGRCHPYKQSRAPAQQRGERTSVHCATCSRREQPSHATELLCVNTPTVCGARHSLVC